MCSQSESVVFKKVVMHARATLGGGTLSLSIHYGWAGKDINMNALRLGIGFISVNRYISVFQKPHPIYIGILELPNR